MGLLLGTAKDNQRGIKRPVGAFDYLLLVAKSDT
jgi:hypothetical protein